MSGFIRLKEKFTVFIGVEDPVNTGFHLCKYVERKLLKKYGGHAMFVKVEPLGGGSYKTMLQAAERKAAKIHCLKFILMDSDRHCHQKEESHPPEHYNGRVKGGFKIFSMHPCSEAVVLRLTQELPDDIRTGACKKLLGDCKSMDQLRAKIGDPDLEHLSKIKPFDEIIPMICASIEAHLAE